MMNTRRDFIKKTTMAASLAGFAPYISKGIMPSADDVIIGHGDYQYKVDKGWAKISVNSTPLFNCHEMVQDQKGRLIMIGDHTHNNILIFDKAGKLLDKWGTAFPGGHGLTLSKEGTEDFLLITDCGYYNDPTGKWNKQSGLVIKTDTTGRLIFALGHPRTIGIYKDNELFMPTETAVAPNGDIYVADGYGSDYIIHYSPKGEYIRHFGGRNNANPDHNLLNAHGVAVDNRDPNNLKLICTSRDENCFKIFTMDGKYLSKIELPGMHICRPVVKDKNIYAGVCWSKDKEGKTNWGDSGFTVVLDQNNKVISCPGGQAPVYVNGKLQQTLSISQPIFDHGHDVCIDDESNMYVCQWNAKGTPPVKLTRV